MDQLVAILHPAFADRAALTLDEQDTLDQVELVARELGTLGCRVETVPCSLDLAALSARLVELAPDACFHLVEQLAGRVQLGLAVPLLLESMGLRYTSPGASNLFLTTDKVLCKHRLRAAGIRTPDFLYRGVFHGGERWPDRFVCKPVAEDGSVGISDACVVQAGSVQELDAACREIERQTGREVLADRYVDGRELIVGLLANETGVEVLPPAELVFVDYPEGKPKLIGYEAKWVEDSFEYEHTVREFPNTADDGLLLSMLERTARECWDLLGLRGYARVDFRVDADGTPYVLEVNVNPCLAGHGGFLAAAHERGLTPGDVVRRIVEDALR